MRVHGPKMHIPQIIVQVKKLLQDLLQLIRTDAKAKGWAG